MIYFRYSTKKVYFSFDENYIVKNVFCKTGVKLCTFIMDLLMQMNEFRIFLARVDNKSVLCFVYSRFPFMILMTWSHNAVMAAASCG